jgi:3-isopropylmalate dehydrogenase
LSKRIAVIPGDGAGKEVVPEAVKVLRAAGAGFEFEEFDIDADRFLRTGVALPDDLYGEIKQADAILFGAIGDPRVSDARYARDVLLRMRFELDLYANLRPARLYDDRLSPLRVSERRGVDLLIVRENTEGSYIGAGGRLKAGTEQEVAVQEDVNTYLGVSRILEYAFELAREEVCMVDKSNAMNHAGALWQERWRALASGHTNLRTRHLYVDTAAMELVRDPTQFDVIVTGNMFGDILSDLAAALVGGMGVAPSANVNPKTRRGLFEPVHGSAPTIAGKGIVNPLGAIGSAAMMTRHLGFEDVAKRIDEGIVAAVKAGECTRDLGGNLSTSEAADAVARRLRD